MLRIALGGISHESNTFNPIHTGLEDFNIIRGEDLLELRVSRFLLNAGADVIPMIYARALPSGTLRYDAYVRMRDELVEGLHEAGKVDGVCLILHGAMEVEKIGDGEGDLVKAMRETVGEEPIISASLDLHGNIFPMLLEKADILTAYRTALHVDVEETRIKASGLLIESLRNNLKPRSFMVKPPVLLPGELVVTNIKPALSLFGQLGKIDGIEGILSSSILVGMAWADSPNASASVIITASDKRYEDRALNEVCRLAEKYWRLRRDFHYEVEVGSIEETIKMAESSSKSPVFISDSGDNVTAGAAGDLAVFVDYLLSRKIKRIVIDGIIDSIAVKHCRNADVGGNVKIKMGGRLDNINGYSVEVRGKVTKLTERGAVLRSNGIDILLASRRIAWTSLKRFEALELTPEITESSWLS